jgi:hypothetical protein
MRNKILCLIALIIVALMILCSCEQTVEQKTGETEAPSQRLVLIEQHRGNAGDIFIYVDTQTRVQYMITYRGAICPMVDENGNILIYEGELE